MANGAQIIHACALAGLQCWHRCNSVWFLVTSRRSFTFALLSLLLVLSQQMGMVHGISHWSGTRSHALAVKAERPGATPAPALEQNCSQCLAFAQIGSALGAPAHAFAVVLDGAPAAIRAAAPLRFARTVCVFQPRAPPVLA